MQHAFALTGGIATGKSTVGNILKLHGYKIIDADDISHKLIDTYHKDIAKLFGNQFVINAQVDRKSLAKLIFTNKEEKIKLENFLHPKIREDIASQTLKIEKLKIPYFIDIPLFFETNSYKQITKSLLIYCHFEQQLHRLRQRENIDTSFAKSKIKSQMSIEDKKPLATYIIDNTKDLKHLQLQIDKFLDTITGKNFEL